MRGIHYLAARALPRRLALFVFLLLVLAANAQAEKIRFQLNQTASNDVSLNIIEDGVTLSLTNANPSGLFDSDSDGLAVLDATGVFFPAIDSFNLSFDQDVRLLTYEIFYLDIYGDESFTISGNNGFTTETSLVDGETAFSNELLVDAGELLTVTSDIGVIGNDGIIQIYSIEVETVVPLPAAAWLFLTALGGLSLFRRRAQRL